MVATPSLDGDKIKGWTKQIAQTFDELGFAQSSKTGGWAQWERSTREIETAFNSEYLECLLEHFFESVETVEVQDVDTVQWRSEVAAVKREEAEETLGGDLEHGQKLRAAHKQPVTRGDVFSAKLAELHEKYPQVVTGLIEANKQDDKSAIDIALMFLGSRMGRLKVWVIAMENNPQEAENLLQSMRSRFVCYNSARFKTHQYISLFNRVNLNSLARCAKKSEALVDVTHFRKESEEVVKRWERFNHDTQLRKLFPMIQSLKDFWATVQSCMRFMGYQSAGKNLRVDSDKLHPNGFRKNGGQRFSYSHAVYFSAWLTMPESGSKLFQEMFSTIIQALQQRVEAERGERGKYVNPPPPTGLEEVAA